MKRTRYWVKGQVSGEQKFMLTLVRAVHTQNIDLIGQTPFAAVKTAFDRCFELQRLMLLGLWRYFFDLVIFPTAICDDTRYPDTLYLFLTVPYVKNRKTMSCVLIQYLIVDFNFSFFRDCAGGTCSFGQCIYRSQAPSVPSFGRWSVLLLLQFHSYNSTS